MYGAGCWGWPWASFPTSLVGILPAHLFSKAQFSSWNKEEIWLRFEIRKAEGWTEGLGRDCAGGNRLRKHCRASRPGLRARTRPRRACRRARLPGPRPSSRAPSGGGWDSGAGPGLSPKPALPDLRGSRVQSIKSIIGYGGTDGFCETAEARKQRADKKVGWLTSSHFSTFLVRDRAEDSSYHASSACADWLLWISSAGKN